MLGLPNSASPVLDYRCALPFLVYAVLRMKPRASYMQSKHSTKGATSSDQGSFLTIRFNNMKVKNKAFTLHKIICPELTDRLPIGVGVGAMLYPGS